MNLNKEDCNKQLLDINLMVILSSEFERRGHQAVMPPFHHRAGLSGVEGPIKMQQRC